MITLTKFISEAIVTNPKDVKVSQEIDSMGIVNIYLKVHPEDIKIIIGKAGKNIKAIRAMLRLKASLENKRVKLILEDTITE